MCLANVGKEADNGFPMIISAGRIIVIIVAIVSSVVVFLVGTVIAVYIWKHREIQRKRRGIKAFFILF